jgi:endonuclease/exonuclease/phosphatase family metal-dependent hydrolase
MRNIKNNLYSLFAIAIFALYMAGCNSNIKKDTTTFKPIPVRHHSCIAAFYNFENFYDTINNTTIDDEEFLPTGAKHYNSSIYRKKVSNLATVVQKIGADINNDGPAILGAVEIENDTVLHDLITHPLLKNRNYLFVHENSKDLRGIDVALLYQPKYFSPIAHKSLTVELPSRNKLPYFTRDILYVKGVLLKDTVHIYVNHWPSRRGGQKRSTEARIKAARVCRNHINTILAEDPNAKIIVMGDLNDNPSDYSVSHALQSSGGLKMIKKSDLYNPWVEVLAKGNGTLANRDAWGIFDQILVSQSWIPPSHAGGLFLGSSHIFKAFFMVEHQGRFKGYPLRTWDGNQFRDGFSDHFPTFVVLLEKI